MKRKNLEPRLIALEQKAALTISGLVLMRVGESPQQATERLGISPAGRALVFIPEKRES